MSTLENLDTHLSGLTSCLDAHTREQLPTLAEVNWTDLSPEDLENAQSIYERHIGLIARLEEAAVALRSELDFVHYLEGASRPSSGRFVDGAL
jgi:hypothetical protein